MLLAELAHLFRRRRVQALLIVLALVPVLIVVAVKLSGGPGNGEGPTFLNEVTHNGVFAALDWLVPGGQALRETVVFEDRLLAMARRGHPILRQGASLRALRTAEFVILRPRVDGEHPVPALREWRRLELRVALEVSEFIEALMVAGQSDLVALVPRSMRKIARAMFGLRMLHTLTGLPAIPIRLIWHPRNDGEAGHAFLRKQLIVSTNHTV